MFAILIFTFLGFFKVIFAASKTLFIVFITVTSFVEVTWTIGFTLSYVQREGIASSSIGRKRTMVTKMSLFLLLDRLL